MDIDVATHDLVMIRHIPATPAVIFAALTEPEQIKAWWGPYGMTATEAEVDLREGGFHRTLLRDGAGKEYLNRMAIDEVAAPHRLVLRVVDESCGPIVGATGTIRLAPEEAGGTRFEVRWAHPTPEMRDAHEAMGFHQGWAETLDKLTAFAASQVPSCGGMPAAHTQEHGWLHRLIGEWEYDSECMMPDGQTMRSTAKETVTTLGGYWVVGQIAGEMPGGGEARSTITMGFDPVSKKFRGTFVGSMMAHMFVYTGTLDADGKRLVLDTEGPAMTGEGMARYRDIVELVSADERLLLSEVAMPDGSWMRFMTGRAKRVS
jgi:uncharacterized protein YndB with AHSA1/START domain